MARDEMIILRDECLNGEMRGDADAIRDYDQNC
jgi:hypothetical protein